MAAPSATSRGTPDGIALCDGFSSLVTLGSDATIELWEKSVKPPSVDGGDAIKTTTMHNSAWHTYRARQLLDLLPVTFKAAYDPDVYDELTARVNDDTDTITVRFSDGSTVAFFGFLQKFEPDELVEGEPPTATCTIHPTNWDTTNSVEAGFTLVEVAAT